MMEENLEKREEKVMKFIRKNWKVLGLLLIAFLINFYYFLLTKTQPLWWDEAVYMINASHLLTGFPSELYGSAGRSILEVFMWAVFYKLGLGFEIFFRFLHVIFMTASVGMIYYLGKKLFNEFVGLFAGFISSIFWTYLFVTSRLMPDNFGLFVFLLAMVCFYKGYLDKNPNPKYLWLAGPLFMLAVYAREITALFGPILVIFILIKERSKVFTNKNIWLFIIFGLLVMTPFLLFYNAKFGGPIIFFTSRMSGGLPTLEEAQSEGVGGVPYGVSEWFSRISIDALRPGLIILFILGLPYFLKLFIGFDYLFKKTDPEKKRDIQNRLWILLWGIAPFIFFAFFYGLYDERYISTSYPAIFFIAGLGLQTVYNKIKKQNKNLAILAVVLILAFIFIAPFNTSAGKMGHFYRANDLITSRIESQVQIRDAGIWINQYSLPNDLIVAQSEPQLMHYSRREIIAFTKIAESPEEFIEFIQDKKPKYMVLSVFEPHPDWVLTFPQENQELVTPVQAYMASETQPLLIVYEFNY